MITFENYTLCFIEINNNSVFYRTTSPQHCVPDHGFVVHVRMNYQKVYMNHVFSSTTMGYLTHMWRGQLLCDAVIKTGSVVTKVGTRIKREENLIEVFKDLKFRDFSSPFLWPSLGPSPNGKNGKYFPEKWAKIPNLKFLSESEPSSSNTCS